MGRASVLILRSSTLERRVPWAFSIVANGERQFPGLYLVVPLAAGEEPQYTAHGFYIASNLVEPIYVGFWGALGFHGFTAQVPRSVYVGTTKRLPDRTVHDVEYHFVTLAGHKLFGPEPYSVGGHPVPIATPEKTLADCADQPRVRWRGNSRCSSARGTTAFL